MYDVGILPFWCVSRARIQPSLSNLLCEKLSIGGTVLHRLGILILASSIDGLTEAVPHRFLITTPIDRRFLSPANFAALTMHATSYAYWYEYVIHLIRSEHGSFIYINFQSTRYLYLPRTKYIKINAFWDHLSFHTCCFMYSEYHTYHICIRIFRVHDNVVQYLYYCKLHVHKYKRYISLITPKISRGCKPFKSVRFSGLGIFLQLSFLILQYSWTNPEAG
jgi:hypothetical protein